MPIVLADLGTLVVLIGALILCYLVVYFAKAFFGVTGTLLGKLPIVGGWIDSTAHHIEQRITSVFGAAAAKVESGIGATWHASARLVDWMGREIASHAGLIATLAQLIPGGSVVAGLARQLIALSHLAAALAHRIEGIGHDVVGRIGHIERGIGADVLPRIRSLEREVTGEITRERVRARTAERTLEREVNGLWKWARTHPWTLVTDAVVAAVAIALSRLGLGWLRCTNTKKTGPTLCGMDADLLESLLADTLLIVGSLSLVEFAKEMQTVTDDAARVIQTFWRAA